MKHSDRFKIAADFVGMTSYGVAQKAIVAVEELEARIAELEAENARLASELAEAKAAQPTAPSGDWREHPAFVAMENWASGTAIGFERWQAVKDALPAILEAHAGRAVQAEREQFLPKAQEWARGITRLQGRSYVAPCGELWHETANGSSYCLHEESLARMLNALPDIIEAECAKAVAQAVEERYEWARGLIGRREGPFSSVGCRVQSATGCGIIGTQTEGEARWLADALNALTGHGEVA